MLAKGRRICDAKERPKGLPLRCWWDWHAWEDVHRPLSIHRYQKCTLCGAQRIIRARVGYQHPDPDWERGPLLIELRDFQKTMRWARRVDILERASSRLPVLSPSEHKELVDAVVETLDEKMGLNTHQDRRIAQEAVSLTISTLLPDRDA